MFCQRTLIKICAFTCWKERHARVTLGRAACIRVGVKLKGVH